MLKWLVIKNPNSPTTSPPSPYVTEDPLATLSSKCVKNEPIYSVSRVNPIFEEEHTTLHEISSRNSQLEGSKGHDDPHHNSPQTDHGSVRSSGYGSKEADSVSSISDPLHEDEACEAIEEDGRLSRSFSIPEHERIPKFQSGNPGTVAQLRKSFEDLSNENCTNQPSPSKIEIVQQNPKYVKSIDVVVRRTFSLESIPEDSPEIEKDETYFKRSYWPRVSHLAQALQKQADEIMERKEVEHQQLNHQEKTENRVQNLRFNPLVSVVAQDGKYVTAISVSPGKPLAKCESRNEAKPHYIHSEMSQDVPLYFKDNRSSLQSEFPLLSLQPDSLVNEDTLRMMQFPGYEGHLQANQEDPSQQKSVPLAEMPFFNKAIYSGFNSGIKKKPNPTTHQRPRSHPSTSQRATSAFKHSAKKKGAIAAKDLWAKSGLKTNGRKLLVDFDVADGKESNEGERNEESLASQQYYHSMPSISGTSAQVHHYENISPSSSTSSLYYGSSQGNLYCLPYRYPGVSKQGIDNPAFVQDRFSSLGSLKPSPSFQHNLTDFPKRLTERLKDDGKSAPPKDHRKQIPHSKFKNFTFEKTKRKKSNSYPGKAVMEFGLSDAAWKRTKSRERPKESAIGEHSRYSEWRDPESQRPQSTQGQYGRMNRDQVWDTLYRKHGKRGKDSRAYFIPPHPNNGGASNCKPHCHDFTIDAHNIDQMVKMASRKQKRQRCCSILLVLLALICFIGTIIGISWFYTGGEKLFGSM